MYEVATTSRAQKSMEGRNHWKEPRTMAEIQTSLGREWSIRWQGRSVRCYQLGPQTQNHLRGYTVVEERIKAPGSGREDLSFGSIPPVFLPIRFNVPAGKKETFAASSFSISRQGKDLLIGAESNKSVTGTEAHLCIACGCTSFIVAGRRPVV